MITLTILKRQDHPALFLATQAPSTIDPFIAYALKHPHETLL